MLLQYLKEDYERQLADPSFRVENKLRLNLSDRAYAVLLDDMDALLLMTVDPGFAGQKLIPQMIDKIKDARTFLDERGYQHIELEVDGNVSFENATKMYEAGADIFVAGSSSIFHKEMDLKTATEKLRSCIGIQ